MSLTVIPSSVRADATALCVYLGQPNRSVSWSLTGSGTLTPIDTITNYAGQALAKYTPGAVGDTVTVSVTAGA